MRLQINGSWPGRQTLRKGWARASIRPWNDDLEDAAVRLERGNSQFLADVSNYARETTVGSIFSPALHRSATNVWARAGYTPHVSLDIMELKLPGALGEERHAVREEAPGDRARVASIDDAAFEGFWRIGRVGVEEALEATNRAKLFVVDFGEDLVGYAVVGSQLGGSFLQRIAVHPDQQGQGVGSSLLARCAAWAMTRGAGVMMLNVRPGNRQATEFYEGWGFVTAPEQLKVMRFEY